MIGISGLVRVDSVVAVTKECFVAVEFWISGFLGSDDVHAVVDDISYCVFVMIFRQRAFLVIGSNDERRTGAGTCRTARDFKVGIYHVVVATVIKRVRSLIVAFGD